MAKKDATRNHVPEPEPEERTRTRTMPEYTLLARYKATGETTTLIRVKGSSAGKAVFALAKEYLADQYDDFRLGKFSTVHGLD